MDKCPKCGWIHTNECVPAVPPPDRTSELARIQKYMDGDLISPAPRDLTYRIAQAIEGRDAVINKLESERNRYRAALSRLLDHAEEVRNYADGWEWKYGQAWDEEVTAARAVLEPKP